MIASQPIANPNRTPTHEFIGEWRASGARQGLPRWMVIANEDGTPTAKFLAISRAAWNLSPTIGVTVRDPIINLSEDGSSDGTPTEAMITAFSAWTS